MELERTIFERPEAFDELMEQEEATFDELMEVAEERYEEAFMEAFVFEKIECNNINKQTMVIPSNVKKFIKLGLGENTFEKSNDVNVLLDQYEFVSEELIKSLATIEKKIPVYLSTTDYVYAWKMHEMVENCILILGEVMVILLEKAKELEEDKSAKYNFELNIIIGYLADEIQNMLRLSEMLEDELDFETNIEYLYSL